MAHAVHKVDFHCHIQPGADHGSDSLEMSLRQATAARSFGVTKIIATPHYYPSRDNIPDFLERRARTLAEPRDGLQEYGIPVTVVPGGEIALSPELPDDPDLDKLCMGNSRYMLLELPLANYWTDWVYESVYRIQSSRRILPIIAHVDRYDSKMVEPLFKMNLCAQVNASAFDDFFSRRRVCKWVENGSVHFLGSDLHDSHFGYYESFVKAYHHIEKIDPQFFKNELAFFQKVYGEQ